MGSLIYSFFEIKDTPKLKSFLKSKSEEETLVEEETRESTEVLIHQKQFLYNDMQNIVAYQSSSFENIAHCHYYLRHIKNDTRAEFDDRSWTKHLKTEVVRLFVNDQNASKHSQNTFKHAVLHEDVNLIAIPVRGRYCQHLDFFDLSEVYNKIFPQPLCAPEQISCPKCFISIPFDELIYLKQVEVILEMIKQFYLEGEGMSRFIIEKVDQSRLRWEHPQKTQPSQEQNKTFVLQDLRLVLNHQSQSVKLKGKYTIKNGKIQPYESESEMQQEDQAKSDCEMQFEENLNKEIYETLLNPNKKFKSTKKLNRFLKNFGRSKYVNPEWMGNDQNLMGQKNSLLNFDQKIESAKRALLDREKLYKDLEKGTIQI